MPQPAANELSKIEKDAPTIDLSDTDLKKRLSITMPERLVQDLEKYAKSQNISLAEAIRRACAQDLKLRKELENGEELFLKRGETWFRIAGY
jgi:hypothetical protein